MRAPVGARALHAEVDGDRTRRGCTAPLTGVADPGPTREPDTSEHPRDLDIYLPREGLDGACVTPLRHRDRCPDRRR